MPLRVLGGLENNQDTTSPFRSRGMVGRVNPNNNPNDAVIFAVNDISFHPVHGTFSTCGGDGTIGFWDKDARIRLKTFDAAPGPISSSAFSRDGSIFGYSVAYDWHKVMGG
ncbi:hypothetical protein K438DRAFT_2013703 [Mycena galopus ATCC 62051]|nr:hypothetical protein K438DRAFT_2013703 [Mycena galopus ATCC 62051]